MSGVDPKLVNLFNEAGSKATRNQHEESSALYDSVVWLLSRDDGPRAGNDFTGTDIRRGYCLMDLQRNEDALASFEQADAYKSSLTDSSRSELELARGNVLGNLGRLDDCFHATVAAIGATEDAGDFTAQPGQAWVWVLKHAEKAHAWTFLEAKARMALQNAALRGNATLGLLAQDFLKKARAKPGLS